MVQYLQGAPRSDDETFFWFSPKAERCRKNLQSAKCPAQSKSVPGNNVVRKRNHSLYHFKIAIHLHLASFYSTNNFRKKNQLEEMLYEQTIKFELKRLVPLGHIQRWSPRGRPWPRGRPRGHNLESLASKVKSLALVSKPQVLENCPVFGSRTTLFFYWKTPETLRKICEDLFCFPQLKIA